MSPHPARFVGESPKDFFIPRSVTKTKRDEIGDEKGDYLIVRKYEKNAQCDWECNEEEATLPPDLQGYVFIVGALFQDEDKPLEYGTPVYTGDGMIYRLGFDQGKPFLKTRITKTPCYYADLAIAGATHQAIWEPKTEFAKRNKLFSYFAAFRDGGPSRYSIVLGGRNQLNTAFLKVGDHLFVTIDAGRPYEVDPDSLELLSPVGKTSEWLGILPIVSKLVSSITGSYPFDIYINSAHPVADLKNNNKEFFTTNYSTGYNGIYQKPFNWLMDRLNDLLCGNFDIKDQFGRFTDLIRYQLESGKMERWRLVLTDNSPQGEPVIVEQSLHQLAITEDFIILADIAFKMEFSQIFAPFMLGFLKFKVVPTELREWFYSTFLRGISPLPYGIIYIVKRSDLDKYPSCKTSEQPTLLPAKRVILPREISHFAADYANPDGKITLHIGHSNGWDVTECLTVCDRAIPGKPPFRQDPEGRLDLEGMMVGPTDLGTFGKYIIDGESGKIEHHQLFNDSQFTWSLSLYTNRELGCEDIKEPETTFKNIYWIAWGFTWELIPERIYEAYKSREGRVISIEELPDENQQLTLLRLDAQNMTIADSFQFPFGYFVSSIQFVPSSEPLPHGGDLSIHGYIVCIVLTDNPENEAETNDEFWIFHADDFQNKPIYRLSSSTSEPLNIALTIHSTWMVDINKGKYYDSKCRQEIRRKSVYEDYENRLKNANKVVHELFDDVVYDYFIQQVPERDAVKGLQQPDYKISESCQKLPFLRS